MITRDFLVRAQKTLGLNCRQMAQLAGVSKATMIAWRAGRYRARGDAILRVVNALLERGMAV